MFWVLKISKNFQLLKNNGFEPILSIYLFYYYYIIFHMHFLQTGCIYVYNTNLSNRNGIEGNSGNFGFYMTNKNVQAQCINTYDLGTFLYLFKKKILTMSKNNLYDKNNYYIVKLMDFESNIAFPDVVSFLSKTKYSKVTTDTVNNKSAFTNHVFVYFDCKTKALAFNKKGHYLRGQLLKTKMALNYDQNFKQAIEDLEKPRRVQICGIPKNYTTTDVTKIYQVYGQILDFEWLKDNKKPFKMAYIIFESHNSAIKCEKDKHYTLPNYKMLFAKFAFPQFSKQMKKRLHPDVKQYVNDISLKKMLYCPDDYAEVIKKIASASVVKSLNKPSKQNGEHCFEEVKSQDTNDCSEFQKSCKDVRKKDALKKIRFGSKQSTMNNFLYVGQSTQDVTPIKSQNKETGDNKEICKKLQKKEDQQKAQNESWSVDSQDLSNFELFFKKNSILTKGSNSITPNKSEQEDTSDQNNSQIIFLEDIPLKFTSKDYLHGDQIQPHGSTFEELDKKIFTANQKISNFRSERSEYPVYEEYIEMPRAQYQDPNEFYNTPRFDYTTNYETKPYDYNSSQNHQIYYPSNGDFSDQNEQFVDYSTQYGYDYHYGYEYQQMPTNNNAYNQIDYMHSQNMLKIQDEQNMYQQQDGNSYNTYQTSDYGYNYDY